MTITYAITYSKNGNLSQKGAPALRYWIIPLIILIFLATVALSIMLVCFFMAFFASRRRPRNAEEYPVPTGKIYDPHREQMIEWIKQTRALEHTALSLTSFDGLRLTGKYFECKKGAPIEILFHGYKGTAERDLSGGVYRCFRLGHNALLVDQRCSSTSEGHVITFGAREYRDCLAWVDLVVKQIDPDAKIILTGISMGAATVLTAASRPLPDNVVGILADCGYTSTRDIIKKVMRDLGLPADLLYPFARLSAILFGRFDPDATSPIESMKKCHLPVIFFHGDTDDFVPCEMSRQNYEACASEHKRLVITPGAGHGLCFPIDMQTYLDEMEDFFAPYL